MKTTVMGVLSLVLLAACEFGMPGDIGSENGGYGKSISRSAVNGVNVDVEENKREAGRVRYGMGWTALIRTSR